LDAILAIGIFAAPGDGGVRLLLIHRGSAESKDSNDRMETKLYEIQDWLDRLAHPSPAAQKGKAGR
jgi:hypothetical protein